MILSDKSHSLYKKIMKKQVIEDYDIQNMNTDEIRNTFILLQKQINLIYATNIINK